MHLEDAEWIIHLIDEMCNCYIIYMLILLYLEVLAGRLEPFFVAAFVDAFDGLDGEEVEDEDGN